MAHGERLLGHALAATGDPAACTHLEAALTAFLRAGIPYRTAQTRLLLARVLKASDREVAGAEAGMALSVFEDLGAGRDADAAAALMRDLGVKAARTGPRNAGRLTRREQEVLVLLGEGLSNPEIGTLVPLAQDGRAPRGARSCQSLACADGPRPPRSRPEVTPEISRRIGEFADAQAAAGSHRGFMTTARERPEMPDWDETQAESGGS